MGIARLLAKGWVVFCVFAGIHALHVAQSAGIAASILICTLWFAAMGILFAAGFGVSGNLGAAAFLARLKPHHLIPGFNEIVFLVFVGLSFVNQVFVAPGYVAPGHVVGGAAAGLNAAIYFAVPGQRSLVHALQVCGLDGGREFSSAFTWLLAAIYLASALSRLKLAAGLIRLEHDKRPETLGPTLRAFLLGAAAVAGIQLLLVGSAYPWLPCGAYGDIIGAVLLGLAPLMLSYLIVAAMASLVASNPEK
ncbi:MAG TPA: hypothetical protein VIJ72_04210 [Rhizomicrobium sp.]